MQSCVTVRLKQHPGVDVRLLLKTYPDLENLPRTIVDNPVSDIWYRKAGAIS
jgi:hypothetical protein